MLGGWLLMASMISILTVATAEGLIGPGFAAPVALTAITAAALLASAVVLGGVCALYGVPVVWGLVAVFVAERGDQPTAAWAALAAAAVVAAASIMAAIRRRPAPA